MSSRCTRFRPADPDLHRIKRRALGLHGGGDAALCAEISSRTPSPPWCKLDRNQAESFFQHLRRSMRWPVHIAGWGESQKPLFIGLKMPFRMAPATADANCVRAGISGKSIESAATASSKNGPTARSANADGKRRRETEAHSGSAKRAMRRRLAAAAAGAEQIRDPKVPGCGCERSPERLIGSPRVRKWLSNSAALNLPLAARPRVGHIGLTGDVAEWLKAAVC
jgi:hypothetical protein